MYFNKVLWIHLASITVHHSDSKSVPNSTYCGKSCMPTYDGPIPSLWVWLMVNVHYGRQQILWKTLK